MVTKKIELEYDSSNEQRIIDAMKGLYPIPIIDDIPEFTDTQWAKESLRRLVVRDVKRWENKVAIESVSVSADDSLIS